jgi:hypothetical protein
MMVDLLTMLLLSLVTLLYVKNQFYISPVGVCVGGYGAPSYFSREFIIIQQHNQQEILTF